MRQRLVDNLNKAIKRNGSFRNSEVKAFGSFMSGLYLPMADMDLVVCSETLLSMGWVTQRLTSKSSLYRFRAFLQSEHIPVARENVQVIAGARVPLVKYVDSATGLKVDISFESIGGVKAVDRFLSWRKQYPAMPILVTIIKQFLAMRGLNEPVNGGIGGFTVICLVVSMLQLMPQVQSGDMIPEHHLGELLLEFFDLYGNRFEYMDVAIRLNPPGYLPKVTRYHSASRYSLPHMLIYCLVQGHHIPLQGLRSPLHHRPKQRQQRRVGRLLQLRVGVPRLPPGSRHAQKAPRRAG